MRQRAFLGVVWLVIGLSGCTSWRRAPLPEPLDTARACADWSWIGMTSKPELGCPEVPGWSASTLFPKVGPAQQPPPDLQGKEYQAYEDGPGPELVRELSRFCVYTIEDPHKKLSKLPFPPAARAGLTRFDQDCAALSLSGETKKSTANWKPLSDRFLEEAGQTRLPRIDGPPRVRLAFLDTQPTGEHIPEQWWNSGHGYALAHIARHLTCSPGDNSERCAAQITTQLALPILRFDPKNQKHYETDEKRGGYIGLQSHLADAIFREVDSWQRDRVQKDDAPQHLVLNVSLGWDPDLFGGLDEVQIRELKAGTQAVYRALQYAASFDKTLVLAAAGNQKRAPCSNRGPLLPAAWEQTALREDQCTEQKEKKEAALIYAVGGLQGDGNPLANARPASMPGRVAYGENAVVPSSDPRFPTKIYTGSSVATAVIASIAAVVWHFIPDLDTRELMDRLDTSGRSLARPPDFQFAASSARTAPPRPVSALSLCSTLQSICSSTPEPFCKELAPCREQTRPAAFARGGERPRQGSAQGSCQPWLYPQPEDTPHPTCTDGCPPRG